MNTTDSATPQAQTQDVVVKPHVIERLVWEAMSWAYRHAAQLQAVNLKDIPSYTETGNANSEVLARGVAARILSAIEVRTWRPMAEAPAGDVSAVIDIWDGERRVTDCFWSEIDKCWLFEDWDGAHYINVAVTDPQAWMWTPKAPEGL